MTALRLLRILANDTGLSLQSVADACDSHRSAVCTAERYAKASKKLRKRLARFFDVHDADELFREIKTSAIARNIVTALNGKSATQPTPNRKKAA